VDVNNYDNIIEPIFGAKVAYYLDFFNSGKKSSNFNVSFDLNIFSIVF